MFYAQFFQASALDSTKLIEATGDRSVVIMDGRSKARHRVWAKEECLKRGYLAWQLMRGESFTRSSPTSQVEKV